MVMDYYGIPCVFCEAHGKEWMDRLSVYKSACTILEQNEFACILLGPMHAQFCETEGIISKLTWDPLNFVSVNVFKKLKNFFG